MIYNTEIEEELEVVLEEEVDAGYIIMLYNDEFNTFDHVIDCLVKYCKQTSVQAEQCSLIVHYKGKCAVKHGSETKLTPVCQALCDHGLSATIEEA